RHVKLPTGTQDARNLSDRAFLVTRDEMMEEEAREHPVEARVRVRKLVRKTSIKTNFQARRFAFPASPFQDLRVSVEATDVGLRNALLHRDRKRPRTRPE